jgi:hypothetical protein
MENHHILWENSLQMAIFTSYVSLPEGRLLRNVLDQILEKSSETNPDVVVIPNEREKTWVSGQLVYNS